MSTMIQNDEAILTAVSRRGVTVQTAERKQVVAWDVLRAAAAQEDEQLAGIYTRLLAVANAMAREARDVDVRLVDRTGTGLSTACEVYHLNGEFAPRWAGHAGAAEGGTMGRASAQREIDDCVARLRRRGYHVETR